LDYRTRQNSFGVGIDPKVTLLRPGAVAPREAGGGPDYETGQTADRIAELGIAELSQQASGRARIGLYDALTTTTRMKNTKRRRAKFAAEGMLRSAH
jgi:hypothetical protein